MRAGEDQCVHGASHADVAETALFFELVGVVESARVREETLLKAGEENEREFEALGGVEGHEGDAGFGVELIGVGGEGGVVEEFGKGFAAGFRVVCGVGQFLEVFNAAEGFRGAFCLKGLDVAGAVDEETDQLGECCGVAGASERCFFVGALGRRSFCARIGFRPIR